MLKQRILTALVLIPVLVALLYFAPSGLLAALFVAILALAAWEWALLSGLQTGPVRLVYTLGVALLSALIILSLRTPMAESLTAGLLLCALSWWCLAAWKVFCYQRGQQCVSEGVVVRLAIGLCVLLPTLLAVLLLQLMGPGYLLLLFVIIWGADSAAYFSGRCLGKHKLASRVSPGKSWEGVIGGLVFVLLTYALISQYSNLSLPPLALGLLLAGVTVLVSVLGDLTESLYKRASGVKDSGSILPGHGGILDRIDSLTAAAPVFLAGLKLTGNLA